MQHLPKYLLVHERRDSRLVNRDKDKGRKEDRGDSVGCEASEVGSWDVCVGEVGNLRVFFFGGGGGVGGGGGGRHLVGFQPFSKIESCTN